MVTIKDIARELNVSTATVSMVLNGKAEKRVKPHIIEQVQEKARELGYKPNLMARSLKTNSTRILGFLSDHIASTPFAGRIVVGAQQAARELGYLLVIVNSQGNKQLEAEEIEALKHYGVDGYLYACMYNQRVQIPKNLAHEQTVIIDGTDEDGRVSSICPDEEKIGYMATRELIDAGCTRIVFFDALPDLIAQELRYKGYEHAMYEAGLEPIDEGYTDEDAFSYGAAHVLDDIQPDGIVCFNDIRAGFIYAEAERRGIHIGQDISVVSVDNQPLIINSLRPGLTSIELPHYEMGYWAVYKLVEQISQSSIIMQKMTPFTSGVQLTQLTPSATAVECAMIRRQSVVTINQKQ
ncbi:LacI family DNA-binding transcriptional regulator [Alloscardovia omnicolens]|uniref:LacI family DNA-binding transcriptional regulator n=1 Tax=Alloscardovia omnicolens TaxID=419015 RepID=A0A2I1M664_9BIFI|nr:LacI family DNA-binding transcriptional regulator [Alloscardovia omnicolens]MDK6327273.1 LacI family DNA-binding transcriptional regulator [Alloscardovia omnicolens]MDK8073636.1 LacI family DNA-binding transcriptional regulator [Alloscardovia omnicolens]MDK8080749.1 LacI family DNA-binding transcriptional regulator [Alloscardovia omnicolens]PKZ15597.1 LacI family DNA-binding transcriptional regulator [Alloscardovia omnicolens]